MRKLLRFQRTVNFQVMGKDAVESVHEASIEILERCGIKVYSSRALAILKDAGANVNTGGIVKMPRHLVEEALKRAPRRFKLSARNPDCDLDLDGSQSYVFTNGTCTATIDLETGLRRRSIKDDVAKTAVIADYLDGIHGYYPFAVPSDVPSHLHGLYELEASLNNTDKHVMLGSTSKPEEAALQIEMARTVAGERSPIISSVACVIPPLTFDKGGTDAAIEFAEADVPVRGMSMPLIGVSSPITLAGSLSISNAELLALLTIIQLVKAGAPFIYAIDPMAMDVKKGIFAPSLPEALLINAASIQLSKHYGLPCGDGFSSSSHIPDGQAGYENALAAMAMATSGADVISGPGGLESYNTLSYEQFLIDYEICRTVFRLAEGIEISDEALATDLIVRIGPSGSFLGDRHTLEHAKECWVPMITDLSPYDTWLHEGKRSVVERAREKAKQIIRLHKPEPLDEDVRTRLKKIVEKGDRAIPH